VAAALLSGAAGWAIGEHMARPVRDLSESARRIEKGESVALPQTGRLPEIEQLRDALDALLTSMRREEHLTHEAERLDQARLAAEAGSRAKSVFLANMNHEIRTPLNAIIGFAQFLQLKPEETSGEEIRDRAEQIERAGEHLLHVINDVLTTAQADADQLPMQIASIDVMQTLEESLELVQQMAAEGGVALQAPTGTEPPPVLGDPVRVRQVLVNLLSNAIKYNAADGSVTVAVDVRDEDVEVTVADQGPGLRGVDPESLFEPFNRGAAYTSLRRRSRSRPAAQPIAGAPNGRRRHAGGRTGMRLHRPFPIAASRTRIRPTQAPLKKQFRSPMTRLCLCCGPPSF
jgi:signal transduction histidine kinase